jgi:Na+-driven multidrug efflux pump
LGGGAGDGLAGRAALGRAVRGDRRAGGRLSGPLASVFASDPAVREALVVFLRWVGPSFGPFGLGMALYFACQGAGRMRWPFAASVARLGFAVGGGWLLATWTEAGLAGAFAAIAAGLSAYGVIIAASVRRGVWR